MNWKAFSTNLSSLGSIILLFSLCANGAATEITEDFIAQTDTVHRGIFKFSASLVRDRDGKAIREIGGRLRPGAAFHEATIERSWLQNKRVVQARGKTGLIIRHVEIRIGPRTVALIDSPAVLNESKDAFLIPTDIPISSWSDLEVLFHITVMNGSSAIPGILNGGRKTLTWRPNLYSLTLGEQRPAGRPPKPAELRPLGAGLIASPETPFVGDTFSALLMLQNIGECTSESRTIRWRYGEMISEDILRPIHPGQTTRITFSAQADTRAQIVFLTVGEKEYEGELHPLKRPRLELISLRIADNFAGEPLEIVYAIHNRGSGEARYAQLRLQSDAGDTAFFLPEIAAGDKLIGSRSWPETFPAQFDLTVTLQDESGRETSHIVSIDRKFRPKARFEILSMSFEGVRLAGRRGRFIAHVKNTGTLPGSFKGTLDVFSLDANASLAHRQINRMIEPGATIPFSTDDFPFEHGLLRGQIYPATEAGTASDISSGGREEFTQIDVAPILPALFENEASLPAVFDSSASHYPGRVRPITRSLKISFPPLDHSEEIDSTITLHIPVFTWEGRAQPAMRVGIESEDGSIDDHFDVSGSETIVGYALPKEALRETITLTLTSVSSMNSFLSASPYAVLPFSSRENGRIVNARATETGVYTTVENHAHRLDAAHVTVALDGAETVIPLQKKSRTDLFLPHVPDRPGYRQIVLTTPYSPRSPVLIEQFVPPVPLPRLSSRFLSGKIRNETGMLVMVAVEENEAPGLTVNHLRLAHAPQGETAVFYLPATCDAAVRYGDFQEGVLSMGTGPQPAGLLRIIDAENNLLRFRRKTPSRSAGSIFLAVNGILTTRVDAPPLEPNQAYFAAIRFAKPLSFPAELVLFEEIDGHFIGDTFIIPLPFDGPPGRSEWDWTAPIVITDAEVRSETSVYLRLAGLAMKALELAIQINPARAADFPISPDAARDLHRTANDTDALGRIFYRERLRDFVSEWQRAWLILSGERLPVTLEPAHVEGFSSSLEHLREIADRPTVVRIQDVEKHLESFEGFVELILGRKYNQPPDEKNAQ